MILLVCGLLLFFGVHSIAIVNLAWRDRMVAWLGVWPWKGLYSLIAICGFALMIYGYGLARAAPVALYAPPAWLEHVAFLLLLPVFPLLFAAYLPGRVKAAVRHPMLAATTLWAFSHLLVNGTLADVLLFGTFLVWAIADRYAVQRRLPQRVPIVPATPVNDIIAVVGGLVVYGLFLVWLHARLIGVALL